LFVSIVGRPGERKGARAVSLSRRTGLRLKLPECRASISGEPPHETGPSAELEKLQAKPYAVNFADDLLNPAELRTMEAAMRKSRPAAMC
jgi:hypothetical protein